MSVTIASCNHYCKEVASSVSMKAYLNSAVEAEASKGFGAGRVDLVRVVKEVLEARPDDLGLRVAFGELPTAVDEALRLSRHVVRIHV